MPSIVDCRSCIVITALLSELWDARRFLLPLFAGALILRLLFVALYDRPLVSDERDFNGLALSLVTTGSYESNGVPTAYRPVGYPLFLAETYCIAGQLPAAARVLQSILDSLIVILLFLFNPKAKRTTRIWGASIWAVFPASILYSSFLLAESLFTFLLFALAVMLVRGNSQSPAVQIAVGIMTGVLALIKPWAILLILGVGVLKKTLKYPARAYVVSLSVCLLTVSPWLIRNALTMGTPTLSTNGGMNLLVGNHPGATGAYSTRFPMDSALVAAPEVEQQSLALRTAVRNIVNDPAGFLVRGGKKMAMLLSSEGELLVLAFAGQPTTTSERYARKYSSLPALVVTLLNVPTLLMLLLSAMGIALGPRDVRWKIAVGAILVVFMVHFFFFGGSRFRFPLMPFAARFAAVLVVDWRALWSQSRPWARLAAILGPLLILSIWILERLFIISSI